MNFIKQNKVLTGIGAAVAAIGLFWYVGYADDRSTCEDIVRFYGKSSDGYYCVARSIFGHCEQYDKRYPTYDMAMDACMKNRR